MVALLVALGPILVMVGIGVGIAGIGNDDFTMVNIGMAIAAIGLVVTVAGFVVLRRSASRPKLDPFDGNFGDSGDSRP